MAGGAGSPFTSRIGQKDQPVAALLDAWAEAETMLDLLQKGDGAAGLRGYAYTLALQYIQGRRDKLESLAHTYLPSAVYQDMDNRIEEYADTNPLSEESLMPSTKKSDTESFSIWSFGHDAVGSIVRLSFLPGRLAGGVAEGGMALGELRSTTAAATRVAEQLPQRIREEIEVLLKTLEEQHREIMEILTKMEAITANTKVAAKQAEQTAAQVDKSLDNAKETLPRLNETVQSIETAAVASRQLTDSVYELLQQYTEQRQQGSKDADTRQEFDISEYKQTAEAVQQSAQEVRDMLAEIRTLTEKRDDAATSDEKNDFQITEYRDAALAVKNGAAELRQLLAELRLLAADEELPNSLAATAVHLEQSADDIATRSERVIDHAVYRALQVIFAFFLLLAVYTCLRSRLLSRRKHQDQA